MPTPKERLRAIFTTVFELEADTDVEGLQYRGIKAWDSVGHMTLIAAIERDFDILLETDQILDLSSFDKAAEIVAAHGHAG